MYNGKSAPNNTKRNRTKNKSIYVIQLDSNYKAFFANFITLAHLKLELNIVE